MRTEELTGGAIGATAGGNTGPGATGIATSTGALVVPGTTCAGCCHAGEGATGVGTGIGAGVARGGSGMLGTIEGIVPPSYCTWLG